MISAITSWMSGHRDIFCCLHSNTHKGVVGVVSKPILDVAT